MSASPSRQQRRAYERARARFQNDRIDPERIPEQRRREKALLAQLDGLPAPDSPDTFVALLFEGVPPILLPWDGLPAALKSMGLEIHGDTIGLVERIRAGGYLPAVTFVGGWTQAYGKRLVPLSAGGVA